MGFWRGLNKLAGVGTVFWVGVPAGCLGKVRVSHWKSSPGELERTGQITRVDLFLLLCKQSGEVLRACPCFLRLSKGWLGSGAGDRNYL